MPEDIHNVAAFIGSFGMPISDALARAAPFLVSNGEVSWERYLSLLLVLLLGAVITIVVVTMFTGKSKQEALRNAGIFLLGVPFALTPLTVPVTVLLFAYAAWRSIRPAARAHQ
ncbi:hypothetical protein [Xanthomonas phaseoli]|uniref:hypothetical protein n=1 Tax=Xanthomonas phaseoli TaxID=1985254 RepID=UPI001ED90DA5|nr:hypothetical protein [Xanthomonas phaseoli]